MKKYKLWYGLGGGFGGATDYTIDEFETEEQAEEVAFELACERYDGYVGGYGLRDMEQIMEEDGLDEEDAGEVFDKERSSWLDYRVEEIEE